MGPYDLGSTTDLCYYNQQNYLWYQSQLLIVISKTKLQGPISMYQMQNS